jgi:hypothetical protein
MTMHGIIRLSRPCDIGSSGYCIVTTVGVKDKKFTEQAEGSGVAKTAITIRKGRGKQE